MKKFNISFVITDMKKIVIINKMKKYEEILHNQIHLLYEKLFHTFLMSVQALVESDHQPMIARQLLMPRTQRNILRRAKTPTIDNFGLRRRRRRRIVDIGE